MLSRRLFLSTLLGAVAAGTILTDTKVAEAISLYPGDRISMLVARARAAVTTTPKSVINHKSASPEHVAWMTETDKLFHLIQAEFPVDPSFDEVEFFFSGLIRADGLDEDSLRRISVELVPLAVVRSLVRARLPMAPSGDAMPGFRAYVSRIQPYLICDSRALMTEAGRGIISSLDTRRMTDSQRAAVLEHYYVARDAGRLDQPIDAKTIYEAANA